MVAILQKPIRRSVLVDGKRYFLSFPQLLFDISFAYGDLICRTSNVYVFCQFDGINYAIPFLPNFFGEGFVCLGDGLGFFRNNQEASKATIEEFWKTEFTGEYDHCDHLASLLGFKSIEEFLRHWQQKTKENPNWIPDKTFFGE